MRNQPFERIIEMLRSIALSAVMAATLVAGAVPAMAQGAAGSTCSSDDPSCGAPRAGGRPEFSGRPREVPGDPGYYRPDPRPPRPPRPPHHPRPPYYPPPYYNPAPPPYYYADRIGCREARSIVRSEGFRNVKAIDCEGRQYQFRATYRGRPVIVIVSSRSGNILDVRYR
ncbi:hypothetical protein [Mesorhizobium australicum]|nr:hypothetical protein [Mesorhizobium australicum]